MAVNPGPIDTAPDVPSRSDRATFVAKSENWRDWEKTAFPQVAQAAEDTYTNAQEASSFATAAEAAAAAAAAASGVSAWVSGTTYTAGNVRYSPVNFRTYRRKTNGAGTTDPSLDTTNWAEMVPIVGNAVGAVNYLKSSDVASATTPDIWSAGGNLVNVTGTTATTGFATAPQAGASRWLRAAGAWPLTHGANLILPGSVSYTCSAGDLLYVQALTTTQFQVAIFKADGTPVQNRDGRILLSSVTASSTSLVAFTSVLTSTYEAYDIELINVVPAVTSAVLRLHTSSNGGSSYAVSSGDYMVNLLSSTVATPTPSGYGSITDTYIALHAGSVDNTSSQGGVSGVIRVTNPAGGTAKKVIQGQTTAPANSSTDYVQTLISAVRNSSSAVNGIQISFQNGNIASGIVRIYGIKK